MPMSEEFRSADAYFKIQRRKRYEKNVEYIKQVTGFVITELTPYQYRFFSEDVGNFCDLYPTNQRYHNLITGERGHYKTAQGFLNLQYDKAKSAKSEQALIEGAL